MADGGVFPPNVSVNPLIFDTTASAADPPPAISGGTLAILPDGVTAVAADPDRDTIAVANLTTQTLTAKIALQPHDEPGRLVADAAGHVHVILRRGGALVTIDPVAGTIVTRRAACPIPRGVAYDPATDLVHVACMGGELVSFPAAGGPWICTHTNSRRAEIPRGYSTGPKVDRVKRPIESVPSTPRAPRPAQDAVFHGEQRRFGQRPDVEHRLGRCRI
ncbi:MAG TPA: hypothetical protein VFG23_03625 [Polyangia bacterium]|nr:hypothetical protein [Polyangia bacterium]